MKFDQKKHLKAEIISEEESSSEDDEDAVLLTEELEKGFFKVLSRLKKKDPDLYSENINYFSSENSQLDVVTQRKQLENQLQDYKEWLKGQKKKIEDLEAKKELEALHDIWSNPDINKDEQFLRDYILNKKFLDHDDSFSLEKELEKLSEEEKEEKEQAIFEEKYNCRFENPDKHFFKKYPQTMKKASGKKRNRHSFTETEEREETNQEINKSKIELKEQKNVFGNSKISDQPLIEENFSKKRKSTGTPDVKGKKIKTDVLNIKTESHKEKKHFNKSKNDSIANKHVLDKEEAPIVGIQPGNQSIKQKKKFKKHKNDMSLIEKSDVKVGKNVPGLKIFKEIFNLKDNKLRKDSKPKWHKKQNIKQLGILNKNGNKLMNKDEKKKLNRIGKKNKDRKRKPRHRSLQKHQPQKEGRAVAQAT